MSQFVRLIDHSIIDFFVQKAEDLSYCSDQFLKDTPYLLGDGELYGLSGNLPEESTYGLVVAEAFRDGEDIVLQTAQCGSYNLRCEAGTLAFAEPQIGLAVLEDDFKSPTSGIYLPRLEEVDVHVGGKQTVPRRSQLGSPKSSKIRSETHPCIIKAQVARYQYYKNSASESDGLEITISNHNHLE